jgi:putative ABC transport system substrate-binding protein
MRRRDFIAGLGSAAAWPVAARAQQGDRMRRIGMLVDGPGGSSGDADQFFADQFAAFASALAQAGWVEGRNLTIDRRFGLSRDSRIRAEVGDLVAKSPDVIVCQGSLITAILKQQTRTIPVVFINVGDPVATGFVASFAHPGGNLTGFTSTEFSIASKWLNLLKDITPGLRNVMMLYDPANPASEPNLQTLEAGAPTLGVQVWPAPSTDFGGIERHIESFVPKPNAGMIVTPGAATVQNAEKIVSLAMRHRLPAMYAGRFWASKGGLASYGTIPNDNIRRAAQYVDRILRGEKPSDLPVQAPTKLELVINLKTARALGLTIPETLLAIADEVIQ